jgi:hypothetical protein
VQVATQHQSEGQTDLLLLSKDFVAQKIGEQTVLLAVQTSKYVDVCHANQSNGNALESPSKEDEIESAGQFARKVYDALRESD